MNPDDILWQSVDRIKLQDVLFGIVPNERPFRRFADALSKGRGVVLGYSARYEGDDYRPPVLIVIEDHAAAEVLSWLRTYAPVAFPLSQFARVVLRSDWERLAAGPTKIAHAVQRADKWASLVLGELLAQGDMGLDVGNLPLSRCVSCFSTAIARSSLIPSSRENTYRECLDRLEQIENDGAFSRRSVSVQSLEPVWRLAARADQRELEVDDIVGAILESFTLRGTAPFPLEELVLEILDYRGAFFSDSVETRVVAFQKLISSLGEVYARDERPSELALASVAVGAFLVGRGTAHAFLIGRLGRKWAGAFVWFGLMGGLSGPVTWEQNWSLAAKGVERFLRGEFDLGEASGADLSWAEYSWISRKLSGASVFLELPKSLPRALTIEIVPGAVCQFRLAADPSEVSRSPNIAESAGQALVDTELRNTLDQLTNLAVRARSLLGVRAPGQMSLELDRSNAERSKVPQPRRRKRL